MKALFDIKPNKQVTEEPKKKRGRPRKNPILIEEDKSKISTPEDNNTLEHPKKRGRPPKTKIENISNQTTVIEEKHIDENWTPYTRSVDIDPFVPCEFMVKTSEKRYKVFYGYLDHAKKPVTNDSYLFFLRRKYNNMFIRKVGCLNMDKCPVGYPTCNHCNKAKTP